MRSADRINDVEVVEAVEERDATVDVQLIEQAERINENTDELYSTNEFICFNKKKDKVLVHWLNYVESVKFLILSLFYISIKKFLLCSNEINNTWESTKGFKLTFDSPEIYDRLVNNMEQRHTRSYGLYEIEQMLIPAMSEDGQFYGFHAKFKK